MSYIFNQNLHTGNLLSFTSSPMKLDHMHGYCIQVIFTGNPTGILSLQGSDDSVQILGDPKNWNTIADSPQTITGSGIVTYNVALPFYNYVQVVYSDSSGGIAVGTVSVVGNGKEI